jgi:hypothetical protein
LNPGEDKAIDQDREALGARQRCDYVGSFPGFSEDLAIFWMAGAIYESHVVSPSGRGRKKTPPQKNKESIAEHRPLLGSRRSPEPLGRLSGKEEVLSDGRRGRRS